MESSIFNRSFWGVTLLGLLGIWGGNHYGAWYVTSVIGFLIGIAFRRARLAVLSALLAGLAGWGSALVWQNFHYPIGPAASMISGVMGFGSHHGFIVVLLSLMVGMLLSLTGAWLGSAMRKLVVWTG